MPHNSASHFVEANMDEAVKGSAEYKKTPRTKQTRKGGRRTRGVQAPNDKHLSAVDGPSEGIGGARSRSHSQLPGASTSSQLLTPKSPSNLDAYSGAAPVKMISPMQRVPSSSSLKPFSAHEIGMVPTTLLTPEQSPDQIRKSRAHRISSSLMNNALISANNLDQLPTLNTTRVSPPMSAPRTPPPLLQTFGSDIERIHQQYVAERAARLQETDSRRPEYLQRLLCPPDSHPEQIVVPSNIMLDQENRQTVFDLGMMDSTMKGRRVILFQETSEESFEQSLLAGGYPPNYSASLRAGEPSTPEKGHSDHQQAQQGSSPSRQSAHAHDFDEADIEDTHVEMDIIRSRRLAAFRDSNRSTKPHNKLYVVEVEGLGRILQDHQPEEITHVPEPSPKKRSNHRKKTRHPSGRKAGQAVSEHADVEGAGGEGKRPNWPDGAFPWSMRAQERIEQMRQEEGEKLKRIQWYLERDSGSEDEGSQSLGLPPTSDDTDEEPMSSRDRGQRHRLGKRRRCESLPNDPADARAALLSRQSVRTLAERRQLSSSEDESDESTCVCQGTRDEDDLVQCDDCHRWYHLDCIGVTDAAELGKAEDPWYCPGCLGTPFLATSWPRLVPMNDDLPPPNKRRRDLLFFQRGPEEESPPGMVYNWGTPSDAGPGVTPITPTRHPRELEVDGVFSSRSSLASQEDSSPNGPLTPSTSRTQRIRDPPPRVWYGTPPGMVGFGFAVDEPFDPSSTPSRGLPAAVKLSGTFTTPQVGNYLGAGAGAWLRDRGTGGRNVRAAKELPLYRYDESPVRRSELRG